MKTLASLRDKKLALGKEAHDILNADEDKALTQEQGDRLDAIYLEIEALEKHEQRVQKFLDLEAQKQERIGTIADKHNISTDEAEAELNREKAIMDTWMRFGVKGLSDEQREYVQNRQKEAVQIYGAQSTGIGSEGGYLVPEGFADQIIKRLDHFSGMRQVSNIIQTSTGAPIPFPTSDETQSEGEIVGENQAATEQDITFGTKAIGSYKFSSKVVKVSLELLEDSKFNLEDFVFTELQKRVGRVQNRKFTLGNGANEPEGALEAAGLGKTGASGQTTSVIFDDLVDLEHAVPYAYREGSLRADNRYMFSDDTHKILKKIKDSDGRPLWTPAAPGIPIPEINGYGYTINSHIPNMAASAKSILFGNFKKYTIRDIMAVSLFRLDTQYIVNGQIGFLLWARADGKLLDHSNDCLKYYQNAAS